MDGTLVDYLYEPNGPTPFKCGYCKSPDTSMIQGVLAYCMTCQDYQDLVDRGFQRSGRFVYRPVMKHTCCPQYVFRVDIAQFRQSKQQRATVRKMNKYLVEGQTHDMTLSEEKERSLGTEGSACRHDDEPGPSMMPLTASTGLSKECYGSPTCSSTAADAVGVAKADSQESVKAKSKGKKPVRPGVGADPNRPPCKKAKVRRMERKAQKTETQDKATQQGKVPLTSQSAAISSASGSPQPVTPPPIAEWQEEKIAIPSAPSCAHTFSTRLVCCNPRCGDFITTFDESYQVFKKFQMGIHNEDIEDCRERHFNEFLVETPLTVEKAPEGSPCDYGSYHLQYLIDGKIFAVGVLDILPKGVLCEYLYYDPAYRFIAPGVYTALHEIAMSQKFYKANPDMQYYYMGFYVQSCPKMNYKRQYHASQLLCTETYEYVDLPKCIPILKVSEYSRLGDPNTPEPEDDKATKEVLDRLPVLWNMEVMSYEKYRTLRGDGKEAMMRSYVELMGAKVALRSKVHIGEPMMRF